MPILSDRFLARFTSALPNAGRKLAGKSQTRLYRLSGGRLGGKFGRAPVLLLTTTGRKSGRSRTTPVIYARDGERLVVIGSNAGSDRPPAWSLNLLAKPEAEVLIGRKDVSVIASVADGAEHDRLWDLMMNEYSGLDTYRERTSREIKVFVLDLL